MDSKRPEPALVRGSVVTEAIGAYRRTLIDVKIDDGETKSNVSKIFKHVWSKLGARDQGGGFCCRFYRVVLLKSYTISKA